MLSLLLLACTPEPAPYEPSTPVFAPEPAVTVFAVRHAEKATGAADPALTEEGVDRALRLAEMLADVELVGVHSTDTTRTRQTAGPTAESHLLDIEPYDLESELVDAVTQRPGAHLVVGHSDTLPGLVTLFDPDADPAPISSTEYDRLYIILWRSDDAVTSLLRY